MADEDWKDRLRSCFESIEILEQCKNETRENFRQFCEFIAEPAFEALAEELKERGIKAKHWIEAGKSCGLRLSFAGTKTENFSYIIVLPKNSVRLKLRLQIKARKTPQSRLEESEEAFLEKVPPERVMKISKEALIEDIIDHYKNFTFAALTAEK